MKSAAPKVKKIIDKSAAGAKEAANKGLNKIQKNVNQKHNQKSVVDELKARFNKMNTKPLKPSQSVISVAQKPTNERHGTGKRPVSMSDKVEEQPLYEGMNPGETITGWAFDKGTQSEKQNIDDEPIYAGEGPETVKGWAFRNLNKKRLSSDPSNEPLYEGEESLVAADKAEKKHVFVLKSSRPIQENWSTIKVQLKNDLEDEKEPTYVNFDTSIVDMLKNTDRHS